MLTITPDRKGKTRTESIGLVRGRWLARWADILSSWSQSGSSLYCRHRRRRRHLFLLTIITFLRSGCPTSRSTRPWRSGTPNTSTTPPPSGWFKKNVILISMIMTMVVRIYGDGRVNSTTMSTAPWTVSSTPSTRRHQCWLIISALTSTCNDIMGWGMIQLDEGC